MYILYLQSDFFLSQKFGFTLVRKDESGLTDLPPCCLCQFSCVYVCVCVCICVFLHSSMGAAGLISLCSGLSLTSSSSILQFLCVCVCLCAHVCAFNPPLSPRPLPSDLNYSSSQSLCVLVSLTYLEANRGVCWCVCV